MIHTNNTIKTDYKEIKTGILERRKKIKGRKTTLYQGEKVTIYMESNANLRTSYDSYKISYEEFLKLVKKAGK